MKAYTTIEQSRKLAEILPLESADMLYWAGEYITHPYMEGQHKDEQIPIWSLAALLEQLKSEIILENKQILFLHLNKYDDTDYEIRYTNSWSGEVLIKEADNLIDACYEMILKLHELNLL